MGIGAGKAKFHPRTHVRSRPVRDAIRAGRAKGAGEGTVRVGLAWPDVALVEMDVDIGEAGQHHRPAEIEIRRLRLRMRRAGRQQAGDLALSDQQIDTGETVGIRRQCRAAGDTGGDARIAQTPDRRLGDAHHASLLRSDSCQRPSNACETKVKNTKIKMPVREISTSAANMRGMLSR